MYYYGQGAIVLAGGDSCRMGRPKTLLTLNGRTLLERVIGILQPCFAHITLVTDQEYYFKHLPVTVTGDLLSPMEKNPLRGIHAGLLATLLPCQFVVAGDMPFLNPDLIDYMRLFAPEYDVVVPMIGPYYQPLHAFYSRSCLNIIEQQIRNRDFKITNIYSRLNVKTIGFNEIAKFDPGQDSFFNVNTWDDYRLAKEKLSTITRMAVEK